MVFVTLSRVSGLGFGSWIVSTCEFIHVLDIESVRLIQLRRIKELNIDLPV